MTQMSEEMRELDERINSWLESVSVDQDAIIFTDELAAYSHDAPKENLGRPCMNCRLRGGRSPLNLRKLHIPAFVLRNRTPPIKQSSQPTSAMVSDFSY